ncbi:uncharacterized protein [Arachis hypogaea]|uniref:uncharacterized protein n=1 Tax=Arachis hypogaea TaxID=3818 RepID=UPI003B218791
METLNYSRRRRRAVATAIATATATAIHLLDANATTTRDTVTFEKEPMPSIPASGEESDEKQSFSSKNNFSSRNASSKYDFVKVKIPNHVAIKIALELKKLLIDNSLLDVYELFGDVIRMSRYLGKFIFRNNIRRALFQTLKLERFELEFIHKSRSTVGYRQNVFSTTLSHLIATNSYHFLIPFIPIRERLKDKLEEFFNCQYKRFVEFTALISWRRGANIGWHSDDNRPYLKQRHFALKIQIPPLPPEGERVFKGCVSASELELMELFEDYTCMIFHCPNPRNTHIFDNCIIQSTPSVSPKLDASTWYPSHSFLTVCFICNKNLGHGKDIYMYRGERAFCNNECCYQGMLMEEEINKLEAEEAVYGT